ncbi:twitch domain-containing radical SAM protein [Halobacteriovorax sp. JY17]|uniref:twitch domain-containing radical SAM protein n=1 Tax=Halobacteriovorax sp. JY17 TaxID=2014617 RepID=UPI000C49523F|nr:twitch domain-containing radical SAM protein [Halobacteriovorax sp. JY17]PIK14014.1 MAG: hypothetical protein CES88_13605 [Halobacteriovorax sp. JY17]
MKKKNSFFCPLPWVHLSLEPGGKVYSCCNTSSHKEIGDIKNESFAEILNSPSNRIIQDQFAKESIPKQCQLCVDAESLGQISLRESSLRRFPDINKDSEPSLKYLSLRLDNICNLKCRTCGPQLSTSWYNDAQIMGESIPSGIVNSFKNEDHFSNFLNNIPPSLEVLYFAGGEPFLSPKFYKVLEKLLENGQSQVEILINTNLTKLDINGKDTLKILSFFENVSLDLSIDGIEEVGEYVRKGMSWIETKSLINKIASDYPTIHLKIFPTISIFNIHHLPNLISYFLDNDILRPSDIRINPLTLPEYLCISNLPMDQKVIIKNIVRQFSKSLMLKHDLNDLTGLLIQLNGVLEQLSLESNDVFFENFINITSQLDRIRDEDIKTIVPELRKYFP